MVTLACAAAYTLRIHLKRQTMSSKSPQCTKHRKATKFATYNPLLHDHDQDELWVSALVNLLYVPKERLNIT